MKSIKEFVNVISEERQIPYQKAEHAIRLAFLKLGRDLINRYSEFDIDLEGSEPILYEVFTVVEDGYSKKSHRRKKRGFIEISQAIERFGDGDIQIGDEIRIPHDISKFGRNGSKVLYEHIERELEHLINNQLYFRFKERIGEKIQGDMVSVDSDGNIILDIHEPNVRAILKKRDRLPNDNFQINHKVSGVIKYIRLDEGGGITVEVSRTTPKYLEALIKLEVPEVADGKVVVNGVARIPGNRAKIAVSTRYSKIDPVSAVIGIKGTRINAVSKELHGEVIDCVAYSPIPEIYVKNVLSPAKIEHVKLTKENIDGDEVDVAYVTLKYEERGKAIGKNGANLLLAKMLTGYDIRLLTLEENKSEEEKSKKSGTERLEALFKN